MNQQNKKRNTPNPNFAKNAKWEQLTDRGITSFSLGDIDARGMREQERINRYRQDTSWRKNFSVWVMCIVPTWLIFAIAVVVLVGLNILHIDAMVLNVLLATTTANILGLAYIVLKGIFPPHPKKN